MVCVWAMLCMQTKLQEHTQFFITIEEDLVVIDVEIYLYYWKLWIKCTFTRKYKSSIVCDVTIYVLINMQTQFSIQNLNLVCFCRTGQEHWFFLCFFFFAFDRVSHFLLNNLIRRRFILSVWVTNAFWTYLH